MKSTTTTIEQGRKTKQGLRDLNYYGPRRVKDGVGDPPAAVSDVEARPETQPPATAPGEAPAEGAPGK